MQALSRLRRVFAHYGVIGTMRRAVARYGWMGLIQKGSGKLLRAGNALEGKAAEEASSSFDTVGNSGAAHPFDVEYGVDTSGLIPNEELSAGRPNALWGVAYYGVTPSVFQGLMDRVEEVSKPDWSKFTFLDLGSGKGRALMMASRFPFGKILGVELSPDLNQVAQKNLAHFSAPWQQCHDLASLEGDATAVDLPLTPLVLFFYNPFLPPVLKACLQNLQKSINAHPREVFVMYVNPVHAEVFERFPFLLKKWEGNLPMDETDIQADRFLRKGESGAVYHTPVRSV